MKTGYSYKNKKPKKMETQIIGKHFVFISITKLIKFLKEFFSLKGFDAYNF